MIEVDTNLGGRTNGGYSQPVLIYFIFMNNINLSIFRGTQHVQLNTFLNHSVVLLCALITADDNHYSRNKGDLSLRMGNERMDVCSNIQNVSKLAWLERTPKALL